MFEELTWSGLFITVFTYQNPGKTGKVYLFILVIFAVSVKHGECGNVFSNMEHFRMPAAKVFNNSEYYVIFYRYISECAVFEVSSSSYSRYDCFRQQET